MSGAATTHTLAIATRNRADALALALPLHLAQARLPDRIVIVDSSPDPGPTAEAVREATRDCGRPVDLIRSAAGTALQRNRAVEAATGDVVFLPDDDTLVHPGAVDALMAVYDADPAGRIGGVCGTPAGLPPTAPPDRAAAPPSARRPATATVRGAVLRVQDRLLPAPQRRLEDALVAGLGPPPAGLAVGSSPLWRLSFRRDAIARLRFEEAFGRYAYFEDADACIRMQVEGLHLVAAEGAAMHHFTAPGRRDTPFAFGVARLLNGAFIALRGAREARRAGRTMPDLGAYVLRHGRLWALRARLLARDAAGRAKARGIAAARDRLPELVAAEPDALEATFARLRDDLVGAGAAPEDRAS